MININGGGELHVGNVYVECEIQPDVPLKSPDWAGGETVTMTAEDVDLCKRVWNVQGQFNNSRFRVICINRSVCIETEFRYFVDDTEIGAELEQAAKAVGGIVDEWGIDPYLDHYRPVTSVPRRPEDRPDPEEPGWFYGADHGRMERHVSIQVPCPINFDAAYVDQMLDRLREATDSLWERAGNAVF